MELTVENLESGFRCIHISGRLDLKGAQEVEAEFSEKATETKQPVLIDLSSLDYVASVGIRMFLITGKLLIEAGAKMVILNPSKMVEEVLKLAGVDTIISIEHDVDAAIEILKDSDSGRE